MGQVRHSGATTKHAYPSCNKTIANFDGGIEPSTRYQPEDGRELAQVRDGRGSQDRSEGTWLDLSQRGLGDYGGSFPAAHAPSYG